jgi:hypothetical protein
VHDDVLTRCSLTDLPVPNPKCVLQPLATNTKAAITPAAATAEEPTTTTAATPCEGDTAPGAGASNPHPLEPPCKKLKMNQEAAAVETC